MRRGSRAIAVVPGALLIAACSAGDFRAIHFSDYRPVPPPKKVDTVVALEVTAVPDPTRYFTGDYAEATRRVVAEDLATLSSPDLRCSEGPARRSS